MIPESVPLVLSGATLAIKYGYYRYKGLIMIAAVALLIVLAQFFQSVAMRLAIKSDKRLKQSIH